MDMKAIDAATRNAILMVEQALRVDKAAPVVRGFFHEPTFTASYVAHDPTTKRAAIVDPVLGFDQASGRASTAFAEKIIAYASGVYLYPADLAHSILSASQFKIEEALRCLRGPKYSP